MWTESEVINLTLYIPSLIKYKLSKAKAGGLYGLWSEWQKLFYIEMKTVG